MLHTGGAVFETKTLQISQRKVHYPRNQTEHAAEEREVRKYAHSIVSICNDCVSLDKVVLHE
jgi:hypothetical protein